MSLVRAEKRPVFWRRVKAGSDVQTRLAARMSVVKAWRGHGLAPGLPGSVFFSGIIAFVQEDLASRLFGLLSRLSRKLVAVAILSRVCIRDTDAGMKTGFP